MDCLQSCQTLPWPARSPDLSPILQSSGNVEYLARHLKTIRQKKSHHPGIFTSARHIVQVEPIKEKKKDAKDIRKDTAKKKPDTKIELNLNEKL
ncbi:hypothetical protein LAZ67_6002634 [Cordylochernes scorpioides]|uniref:Uncharacterized protein n=1 Tax=Cordylochernes scorpioides TaxID=51811 RepID=A0ABY6KJY5_9ARAC|nr:hypothetical protein LAZ67_6002634 [Cordylochernes scorpioides]